ncbi:MAG: hypothetical protein LBK42_08285 [Propionibacteriaceae bacterium]|jgi:hypothetical protein|nr:hypothetical protein [Propionibacteriaceae bacterium]
MNPAAEKNGTGERRSDMEPLVQRFPLLSGATVAVWYSGTTGSASEIGPSTYWIDAVVTVDAETATAIEADPTLTAVADQPDVVAALQPELPTGLVTSAALEDSLTAGGDPAFVVTAFYSPATHKVVISAYGQ